MPPQVVLNAGLDRVLGGIFIGDMKEYSNVLSTMLNDLPVRAWPPPHPGERGCGRRQGVGGEGVWVAMRLGVARKCAPCLVSDGRPQLHPRVLLGVGSLRLLIPRGRSLMGSLGECSARGAWAETHC